jgi:restriction system protein
MLVLNSMRRRRKSKDAAFFEAITGGAGLLVLLFIFSPEFRRWMQVFLVSLAFFCVVALLIWLFYREYKRDVFTPPIEISPRSVPYQGKQPENYKPPTIAEELRHAPPVPELTTSEKLRKIDWFQFEKLIEMIYRHQGFSVTRMGGANPDGGVDLVVEKEAEKMVVQCKHWRKWTVGVQQIREFLGAMTDSGILKGIFVTLVGYSAEAKQLADKHGIQILDESDIVKLLEESDLKYSQDISELFSDERKYCPKCERVMVLRTSRMKGNPFWGCSGFPRCRFRLNFED